FPGSVLVLFHGSDKESPNYPTLSVSEGTVPGQFAGRYMFFLYSLPSWTRLPFPTIYKNLLWNSALLRSSFFHRILSFRYKPYSLPAPSGRYAGSCLQNLGNISAGPSSISSDLFYAFRNPLLSHPITCPGDCSSGSWKARTSCKPLLLPRPAQKNLPVLPGNNPLFLHTKQNQTAVYFPQDSYSLD